MKTYRVVPWSVNPKKLIIVDEDDVALCNRYGIIMIWNNYRKACNVCQKLSPSDELHAEMLRLEKKLNNNYVCPSCGQKQTYSEQVEREFAYGLQTPVILKVVVPLYICMNCDANFFDEEADQIQYDAICSYLNNKSRGVI